MTEIIVPTINTNDLDAVLRQWVRQGGDAVQAGELIAVLETTKASFELEAPAAGILDHVGEVGQRYDFGSVIGRLYPSDEERGRARAEATTPAASTAGGGVVITAAAQRLIDKLGITGEQIRALGKRVLKESDVQAMVATADTAATALSLPQQAIARTVTLSRSTIPDAFLLQKIDVTAMLAALIDYRAQRGVMVGLPDVLVWIAARLAPSFPLFFGQLDAQLRFTGSAAGSIGVTLDVGKGLFIPVIRDAAGLTLADVAARMAGFRMKALRNNFEAADLAGGDLSISLNTDEGTVFVQPIILPPQTCMLSLGAVLKELVLSDGGVVSERRHIHLGVAYDHRIINGFQAGAFAKAVKAQLEVPVALGL